MCPKPYRPRLVLPLLAFSGIRVLEGGWPKKSDRLARICELWLARSYRCSRFMYLQLHACTGIYVLACILHVLHVYVVLRCCCFVLMFSHTFPRTACSIGISYRGWHYFWILSPMPLWRRVWIVLWRWYFVELLNSLVFGLELFLTLFVVWWVSWFCCFGCCLCWVPRFEFSFLYEFELSLFGRLCFVFVYSRLLRQDYHDNLSIV